MAIVFFGFCWSSPFFNWHPESNFISIAQRHRRYGFGVFGQTEEECMNKYNSEYQSCLPVVVGDLVYVRETHALVPASAYRNSEGIIQRVSPFENYCGCIYRENFDLSGSRRWRPSIHMPRWASRITLKVTDVRVQRIQDISEEEVLSEGLTKITKDGSLFKFGFPDRDGRPGTDDHGWPWQEWNADSKKAFRKLWNSCYPGSWYRNDWIFAYSFEVIQQNVDEYLASMEAA